MGIRLYKLLFEALYKIKIRYLKTTDIFKNEDTSRLNEKIQEA